MILEASARRARSRCGSGAGERNGEAADFRAGWAVMLCCGLVLTRTRAVPWVAS